MNPNEKVILNLQLTAQEVYALRAWLAYSLNDPAPPSPGIGPGWAAYQEITARTRSREIGTTLYRALGAAVREPTRTSDKFTQHRQPWFNDRERHALFRHWLADLFTVVDRARYVCATAKRLKSKEFDLYLEQLGVYLAALEARTRLGREEGVVYNSGWCWAGGPPSSFEEMFEGLYTLYMYNDTIIERYEECCAQEQPPYSAYRTPRRQLLALLRSPYCVIPESRTGEYEDYAGQTLDEMAELAFTGPNT